MSTSHEYLLSLDSIRQAARVVFDAAKSGSLSNFHYHPERLDATAEFVTSVIARDFGPDRYDQIPPHGRWQHFQTANVDRLGPMLGEWQQQGVSDIECTRRLVDLFFVSVLLDAGAGDSWRYQESPTLSLERSEGLAVASFHMFKAKAFSSNDTLCVDGKGLEELTEDVMAKGFQASPSNPLAGIDNRVSLLRRLGKALLAQPDVFGPSGRPGGLVDAMMKEASPEKTLSIRRLWSLLQALLLPIWPAGRTVVEGKPLGDAWPLSTLEKSGYTPAIQPFHKLTQWLTYSLMVPFTRLLGATWTEAELLTGLPEYRNGGLFVDMGVLTLKPEILQAGLASSGDDKVPSFDASGDVVVEWRALTVVLLDELLALVNAKLAARPDGSSTPLTMAQYLESGSWKAGRELAAKYRPLTKGSPIVPISDGTLF
ncbi:DUF1688 domain-containing protein [Nemania abortiva]|nr:DUF1688 domain-containing protein [Nemania abortiva]